jgi:hypothetical protein
LGKNYVKGSELQIMADNPPNVPPASPEGQSSKKQTVRINLPPKPTATIKLPTLPAGGPPPPATGAAAPGGAPPRPVPPPPGSTGPGVARPPGPGAGAPPPSAARPPGAPPPPTGARPAAPATAAAAAAAATAATAAAARPPAPPAKGKAPVAAKKISALDVGLAIAAAVVGLGAVGSLLLLLNLK